jgi:hypothetical protein
MTTWGWIILALASCAIAAAAIVVFYTRRRRTAGLRELFGPEYDRTIAKRASRSKGERELAERQERRRRLDIHPLRPEARERYVDDWQEVQSRFVDDPGAAVRDADRLIEQVMSDSGYPQGDFEQRVADVSVDHNDAVAEYRAAHETYARFVQGDASTEELRRSLIGYRALFDELLEPERELSVAR